MNTLRSAAILFLICVLSSYSLSFAESPADVKREEAVKKILESAIEQTKTTIYYDPAYVKLDYPGGDLPPEKGVCADVIVRAFRKAGIDLQKEVHEDMKRNFAAYPNPWKLKRPDANIDHRRVANLMTYFERKASSLPLTKDPKAYQPGDLVAWRLDNGLLHIGIVADRLSDDKTNYKIVHNIGAGAQLEDTLFSWEIIGHYRYF